MAPIEYIPVMRAYYRKLGFDDYSIYEPKGDPWTPLAKPLAQCTLSLICSAGLSRKEQIPYDPRVKDDLSIREIPADTRPEDLVINYSYFDHRDADADINCVFPLWRLKELENEGFIGQVSVVTYAMGVGRWRDPATPERLQTEVADDLAGRMRKQAVDAVLLIPT